MFSLLYSYYAIRKRFSCFDCEKSRNNKGKGHDQLILIYQHLSYRQEKECKYLCKKRLISIFGNLNTDKSDYLSKLQINLVIPMVY